MNEEIMFQLGLGTENFMRGRDQAKGAIHQLKSDASDAGKAIRESFKGAFEVFSVGMLAEAGKKVLEFGESIERGAEIAGTSAGFFQTFGAAMRQTGGDADKGNKALERLGAMLGQASEGNTEAQKKFQDLGISIVDASGHMKDTEAIIREVADLTRNAGDDNKAAAIAVSLFGNKLGLELVPALKAGSKGLDEFGNKAAKLSDSDLKTIKEMNQTLETSKNTALVWAGKVIGSISNVSAALGRFTVTGYFKPFQDELEKKPKIELGNSTIVKQSKELVQAYRELRSAKEGGSQNEDIKLLGLMMQERDIQDDLKDQSLSELDRVKLQTELEKKHNEVVAQRGKMQTDFDKKKQDALQKEHEWQDKISKRNDEIRKSREEETKVDEKLQNAKEDRSRLSLEDLTSSRFRFGGQLGVDQHIAFQIKRLEAQGEWNRQHGFLDSSQDRFNAADSLRQQLSTNVLEKDRAPFKEMELSAKESASHLKDLLDLANSDGIPIDPKMGT